MKLLLVLLHTTSTTKTFAINENKFYFILCCTMSFFLHVDSHKFECSHAMHKFPSFFLYVFHSFSACSNMLANAEKNYYRDFISKKSKIYVKLNKKKKVSYFHLFIRLCTLIFLNNKE